MKLFSGFAQVAFLLVGLVINAIPTIFYIYGALAFRSFWIANSQ